MRLRHALLTCAVLPLVPNVADARPVRAIPTASRKVDAERGIAAKRPLSAAEIASTRASVRKLIDGIDLSYEQFTLPNGLRVIVRTDRRAPIVHVGVWYDVGSKHEPAGRSGFAHLFEHLMFNGSENVPGDYLPYLMDVGAEVNGNTSKDRTSYYEVVPTGALERALFMESDRMGHLLGAFDQATLDEQRGVVQNEKRNGSNAPTAVIGDMRRAALYTKTHPYGHSVIGSMKDLNAADLGDVRSFFKAHYGPNNALLVLVGDIDVATAKQLVTKYFADIPAGPRNIRPAAGPVLLTKTISERATAPVTAPIVVRSWPVAGADDMDALALDGVAETMGGTPESPLQRALVREQKLFQSISVSNETAGQAGEFTVFGQVRPGVHAAVAAVALDREIARYLKDGATTDLLTRWVARYSYGGAQQMSVVNALAPQMGAFALLYGDPAMLKTHLRTYAALTPATTNAVARKWLARPRWELTVTPGPRVTPAEDAGIDGSVPAATTVAATTVAATTVAATTVAATPVSDARPPSPAPKAKTGSRGPLPPVGEPAEPRFPGVEHAVLANGIRVLYAKSENEPYTKLTLSIEGGTLNEPTDQVGTAAMMYGMMKKGFGDLDEDSIAEQLDLTGISLMAGGGAETGGISLNVPDVNVDRGLDLMRRMLTSPTFPRAVLERRKRELLDQRASSRLSPNILIREEMEPLFDAGSPYLPSTMYGNANVLRGLDRTKLIAAYRRWVRPERAAIAVVSDRPLAELLPKLNRTVGTWKAEGPVLPIPPVTYRPQPGKPQIVLIDLPGAVQATIFGGQRVPLLDKDPNEAVDIASNVLGAGFTSRMNMNLRENKHWTYGAGGAFAPRPYSSNYTVQTTVQQDKAGPAIAEIIKEARDIVGDHPLSQAEFDREKTSLLGKLPMLYSNGWGVLEALENIHKFDRPDDYPARAGERLRALTLADSNAAMRAQIDPSKWAWAIVGNAAIIRPQLDELGLPVHVIKAADVLPAL